MLLLLRCRRLLIEHSGRARATAERRLERQARRRLASVCRGESIEQAKLRKWFRRIGAELKTKPQTGDPKR
jgi:hypothetical protein